MKTIEGYCLITPDDLAWRPSNLMRIPNADYLERTGSEILGARLWRLPPQSANTLHKHIRSEEFYFVLEGTGRLRLGDETITVPRYGGVLVGPDQVRQVFNDTDRDALWLIVGAPEELEFLKGSQSQTDLSLFYPSDPTQLPKELAGVIWPPKDASPPVRRGSLASVDFARFAEEWIAAWNAHDLERILSHYADAVEFQSPFISKLLGHAAGKLSGKAALRDHFARGLTAYPALRFEYIMLYPGVNSCVLQYRSVNDLLASETMEFNNAGQISRALAHYATQ
jgi:mannose-6-phosphate isomerase-like protein (cupin superfamily)